VLSFTDVFLPLSSTLQARVALSDVLELLEAAEAKAAYGLAINWKPLQELVTALLERGVLQVGWLFVLMYVSASACVHVDCCYGADLSQVSCERHC
jgi:hypothetical protein